MFTCTEPVFLCTGSFPTRSCGTHSSPRTVNTALGLPEGLSINHEYVSPTSKLLANKVLPCHGSVALSLLALSICRWLTLLMENIWRQGQIHRENTLLITSPQTHRPSDKRQHFVFCIIGTPTPNQLDAGRICPEERKERPNKHSYYLKRAIQLRLSCWESLPANCPAVGDILFATSPPIAILCQVRNGSKTPHTRKPPNY